MMNKKTLSVIALGTALAIGANAFAAPNGVINANRAKLADPVRTLETGLQGGIQAGGGGGSCESTGFEFVESTCSWELGWICGSTFAACGGPPIAASCTGNPLADFDCCQANPNPLNSWWLSGSNQHCNEPHVSQLNPATGENHLRFERDPAGGNPAGCTAPDFNTACRVNAFGPQQPAYAPGPVTIEMDVAMGLPFGLPPFGSGLTHRGVGTAGPGAAAYVFFHYYGVIFVYDYGAAGFQYAGVSAGDGNYTNVRVEFNPCTGIVEYYIDGGLGYTATFSPSAAIDILREFWAWGNIGGTHDVDNYSVVRHAACPTTCGDGMIEGLEQCDFDPGSGDPVDDCCPGHCVAAGEAGECTCTRDYTFGGSCVPGAPDGRPVGNGISGPFLTDGGLFAYTADAPFTSIDTCLSDFDTEIIGLAPDCNTITFYNDECSGDYGGHPLAPCYQASGFPGSSCVCVPTNNGETYTFLVDEWYLTLTTPYCSSTVVNIEKKIDCETIMPGSCCDHLTGMCTNGVDEANCMGQYQTFNDNKSCELSGPCDAISGACCNTAPGAGGACSETLMADCAFDWTPGVTCGDISCEETRGACCNALTGFCSVVLQSQCVGADQSWSEGLDCTDISCNPAQGACCIATEMTAECTQTSQADCAGEWTRDTDCADVTCEPLFTPIPTVSEWGLVIMALLLLVGGKVYFGRRQTAIA
jgi:hypothetical protein